MDQTGHVTAADRAAQRVASILTDTMRAALLDFAQRGLAAIPAHRDGTWGALLDRRLLMVDRACALTGELTDVGQRTLRAVQSRG